MGRAKFCKNFLKLLKKIGSREFWENGAWKTCFTAFTARGKEGHITNVWIRCASPKLSCLCNRTLHFFSIWGSAHREFSSPSKGGESFARCCAKIFLLSHPTDGTPPKRCPKLAQRQDATTGGKFRRIAQSLDGIPPYPSPDTWAWRAFFTDLL